MNPQAIEITVEKFRTAINEKMTKAQESKDANGLVFYANVSFIHNHLIPNASILKTTDWPTIDFAPVWIKYLVSIDPTPKSIYAKWILKRWLNDQFPLFEDVSTAGDLLEDYDAGKKTLPIELRDINRLKTVGDLRDAISLIDPEKLISNRQMDRGIGIKLLETGDAIMHHDDENIRIVIPKTAQAAIYYGRNTRWCTSARNGNMFTSYSASGDLYIILFKKTNVRWQFHLQSGQLMDEQDRALDHEIIRKSEVFKMFDWKKAFKKNPRLFGLLTRPTKEERLAGIRANPSLALKLKNLSDDEIHVAVKSRPSMYVNEDERFRTPECRFIALKADPTLVTSMADATEAELYRAVEINPKLIIEIKKERQTEKMWREAVWRQTSGHYDEFKYSGYFNPHDPHRRLGGPGLGKSRYNDRNNIELIYYIPPEFFTQELLRGLHDAISRRERRTTLYDFDMTKFVVTEQRDLKKIMDTILAFFEEYMYNEFKYRSRYNGYYPDYHPMEKVRNRVYDSYERACSKFIRYQPEYSVLDTMDVVRSLRTTRSKDYFFREFD